LVGLGLSISALVFPPLNIPVGRLADRIGAREITIAFNIAQVLLLVCAVFVHSFATFPPVIVGVGIAENGGSVARSALISGLVSKQERVRISAYNRVITNIGFSIGVFGAGLVIGIGTRAASVRWEGASVVAFASRSA
jgi:MFS family permease